jgi:glucokinase
MVKYARRLLEIPDTQSDLTELIDFSASDINTYAHRGDELAMLVLRTGARYLGIAIGNAINLLDLDCVVIGGGVSRAGNLWWDALRAATHDVLLPWRAEVPLKPSKLGTHEGIWGAVALLP